MSGETLFITGIILAIVGVGMGLTFGIMWWIGMRRTAMAVRMQSVQGTLHEIGTRHVRQAKGASYWSIVSRYEYSVGGQAYTGKRARLEFDNFSTEAKALAVIGDRKAGQPTTVWYDPASPGTATLDRTHPAHLGLYRMVAIIGAVAIVVGAILALPNIPKGPA